MSPKITGGTPSVLFAVRFETLGGKPLDIGQQPPGYRTLCATTDVNPDGDDEIECASHN
ncbi:hypothetical protein IFR04_013703 [Cadophora malorum]|uniref:Uncharacterized protein n=1 Tax=Cadophora malorum TaxID=108018 RepID=A0A8H7T0X4_9HELO|nr:hypothetical protein IFR04_013703 [Cadophora malorum]